MSQQHVDEARRIAEDFDRAPVPADVSPNAAQKLARAYLDQQERITELENTDEAKLFAAARAKLQERITELESEIENQADQLTEQLGRINELEAVPSSFERKDYRWHIEEVRRLYAKDEASQERITLLEQEANANDALQERQRVTIEDLRSRITLLEVALERVRENARSWHGPDEDSRHAKALAVIAGWVDEALGASREAGQIQKSADSGAGLEEYE